MIFSSPACLHPLPCALPQPLLQSKLPKPFIHMLLPFTRRFLEPGLEWRHPQPQGLSPREGKAEPAETEEEALHCSETPSRTLSPSWKNCGCLRVGTLESSVPGPVVVTCISVTDACHRNTMEKNPPVLEVGQ